MEEKGFQRVFYHAFGRGLMNPVFISIFVWLERA